MPFTTKILFAANIFGLTLFLGMAFLLPLHGQSQAEIRYKQFIADPNFHSTLDNRRGPNPDALYIVEPTLRALRAAANVGIALTLLNVSLFTASQWKKKKKA